MGSVVVEVVVVPMRGIQTDRGFTLIEFIAVVVLLGLLGVIALPKFLSSSRDAQLAALESIRGTINQIVSSTRALSRIDSRFLRGGNGEVIVEEFDGVGTRFLEYNASTDIRVANGYPFATDICYVSGLAEAPILKKHGEVESSDGTFRCKYENSQTLKISFQGNARRGLNCQLLYKPGAYSDTNPPDIIYSAIDNNAPSDCP